ncbi:MAG TPA: sigma-54 dependent transcriptional regulator [Thermoanaerobaculia bacterium]|nr:sigma-54 dependent transcriptional regulator [Thermoanaerobaculia bacterium]
MTVVLHALIVEDDKNALSALAELVAEQGFTVEKATSVRAARSQLAGRTPDVVLLDLILPDGTGFDLIGDLHGQTDRVEIVVITGHASVSTAVEALRHGASDYLTKPVDTARLKLMLTNLTRTRGLRPRLSELRHQVRQLGCFGMLVGASPAMEKVYELVSRVAPSSASVLLTGESGTGKELVAETVHQLSRRAAKPYLVVNCGALSPLLIESELFGHERGSFTGADRVHRGYFERADGGTLFLDEVSEMPLELQAKLLRVLEAGAVMRVGGEKMVKVDVRIIAATNRDLDARVAKGEFRSDLLYRLKVFPIDLPPLRARTEDIPALAQHFLAELNRKEGADTSFAPAALAILQRCAWPGNVRELKNVVHRAFILAEGEIDPSHLAPELSGQGPADGLSDSLTTLAEAERRLILASLEHFGGDKRKAAGALGVSLRTLYNRLREYGQA